ncbi:MAG: hypothetical protein O3C40_30170 [Planctomycetota bacterium]|nr:hypothetical protein [Planctomycetota bacterium]
MFVPTADQIERPGKSLETGTSFESRLVQKIKKQCNDLATYQGVFVATPNGLLLAGSHEAVHDPRKVEQHMRQGLEKWAKLSAAERLLSEAEFADALAELGAVEGKSQYPQDGLVLSSFCRDLPRSAKPGNSPSRNAYNQDYAWFRKAEARAFLPVQPIQGTTHQVPRDVVERLARFHFVDLVRGHTASYPQQAVERAELSSEVIEVKGNLVSLRFQGRTRTSEVHDGVHIEGKWNAPGPGISEIQERGVDARLEGQAVYDLKTEKFVFFDLIALSSRWGGNAYNGRLNELDFGPAPMGIVLELAGNSAAEQVPPLYFRYYGWK